MSTTLTDAAAAELSEGLSLVRQRAGLPTGEANLMRFTINAVYHAGEHVIRLARGEAARKRAQTLVPGMSLLARHRVPTVRLVADVAQPVMVQDWVATVWHYLPHPPDRPDPVELAEPLARLHAITEAPAFLPRWSPVSTARRRLANVIALDAHELDYTRMWATEQVGIPLDDLVARLNSRCDELDEEVATASWGLPVGVIHGDAHVGNLLAGHLIDFDSLAVGPREWDLVPLAHSVTRFGDPVEPYRQFVAAYGFDLTTSAAWPLLRDVRELQLVTSVIDKFAGRPQVARTLGNRLRTYFAGERNAVWLRYR